MHFLIQKHGLLQSAKIHLNDLTILCGPNNTGKTMLMRSMFDCLVLQARQQDESDVPSNYAHASAKHLSWKRATTDIHERVASIFEVSTINKADSSVIAKPIQLLLNRLHIREFLKTIEINSIYLEEQHPEILQLFEEIVGGTYVLHGVRCIGFASTTHPELKLPISECSGMVQSLWMLDFYLRHVAVPGSILFIDTPEFSMHPKAQRQLAKLLTQLISADIRIVIVTHSDYLIKELNTLIMLRADTPRLKEIQKRENIRDAELINASQISMYTSVEVTSPNGVREVCFVEADVSVERGIEAQSFDKEIEELNCLQDEIIWGD